MTRSLPQVGVCKPNALPLVLMVAALLFGGCVANTNRSGVVYSTRSNADAEFEAGVNRPPTVKTLFALARILAAQGKDADCGFVLRRIIYEHPRFMPAYCDLAELHLRHRRVEDAVAALSAGLDLSPQDPVLLNNLGMCSMLRGDYAEALEMFTSAAAALPQDARYRANMAASSGMMGRYEECLSLYMQVIPTPDAHYNLGVICEARGDSARAAEEYRRAEDSTLSRAASRETPPVGQDPSSSSVGDTP